MKNFLLLILLITLISLWPFFKKGYFESHDGEWMVIRFSAFHQTLVSGQFPVRYVDRLNNNYGYPVLNFLYPLPFYLAELPKIAGFGFVNSVKIIFILSTFASSLGMFWALNRVFSQQASFAGSILYLYAPYRFVDLYVRGSIGENLAFAVIPFILGSLFEIAKQRKIFLPILSFLTAFLILSHNVMAAIFLPLFIIISFVLIKKDRTKVLAAFLVGILISTFFWLPAIYDLKFVRLSQIKVSNIADHVVPFYKLIVPNWGYAPSPVASNGLSTQIGLVSLAAALAALVMRFVKNIKDPLIDILLVVFFAASFLMTNLSLPIWQNLPLLDVIQFPWRLLSLTVFIAAFLMCYVIDANKKRATLMALVVVASILSTIVYTKPRAFVNRPDSFYSTNEDSTTVQSEYLPLWVSQNPKERANSKIVVGDQATILSQKILPMNYKATIDTRQDTKILINTIYFPGHKVIVDGKGIPIDYQNDQGLIGFQLPKDQHQVIITYTKTPIHLFSEIISLIAIVATIGLLISNLDLTKVKKFRLK